MSRMASVQANIADGTISSANSVTRNSSMSNLIGSISDLANASNAFNIANQQSVNAFNAEQAEINRKWQEKMSNTAHQREVKDLIAAGLNPILSANSGASVGSVGNASADNVRAQDITGVLGSIIGASISASSAYRIAELNAKTNLAIAKLNSDTDLKQTYTNVENPNSISGILRFIGQSFAKGLGESINSAFSGKKYFDFSRDYTGMNRDYIDYQN